MTQIPFVTVFRNIVSAVRAEYDVANNLKPFYESGHPLEIVNTLAEKTRSKDFDTKKYPMIALFQDFTEQERDDGYEYTISELTIIICTETDPKFTSIQRYAATIVPVLYPIYELLKKYVNSSKLLDTAIRDKDKTDRLYWGKEGIYGSEANIFNDYIDAIEIKLLNIKKIKTC